jgi:hypothetical protein
MFKAGRRLESGPQRAGKGVKCAKDVKNRGNNLDKSFRINKSAKKQTQNKLVLGANKLKTNPKKGPKNHFLRGIEARIRESKGGAYTSTRGLPQLPT